MISRLLSPEPPLAVHRHPAPRLPRQSWKREARRSALALQQAWNQIPQLLATIPVGQSRAWVHASLGLPDFVREPIKIEPESFSTGEPTRAASLVDCYALSDVTLEVFYSGNIVTRIQGTFAAAFDSTPSPKFPPR